MYWERCRFAKISFFSTFKEIFTCIMSVVDLPFKMKPPNYFGYSNGNVFVNTLKG